MPTGPNSPVAFNAFYENLPLIVQRFVRYFFTPSMYKGAFFSGLLAATIFAGGYLPAPGTGGDVEHFFFTLEVPAPNAGAGFGFLIAAVLAWAAYAIFRRRVVCWGDHAPSRRIR